MLKKHVMLILAINSLLMCSSSFAISSLEHEILTKVKQELDTVKHLINQAERHQDNSKRFQFRYQQLYRDINKIQLAISEQQQGMPIEPRKVKPIVGDYIQLQMRQPHE